jgi:hypothetical protein
MRNPAELEPRMWLGSVDGALLLRRTTAAAEAADATVHRSRLVPNQTLLKDLHGLLDVRGLGSETMSHPSRTNTSASSTEERRAAIRTEVFVLKSECARTMWITRIAVVARAAIAPRIVGMIRGTNMFCAVSEPGVIPTKPVQIRSNLRLRGACISPIVSPKANSTDSVLACFQNKQKGNYSVKPG